MADMDPLADILNGTAADATDVQANFQILETYINGVNLVRTDGTEVMTANLDLDGNTLANISGLAMNATKITGLATGTATGDAVNLDQFEAVVPPGAWTSYTPTFTQSATISKTVNYAKYTQIGRTVHVVIQMTATSNGTGGADHNIVVSVPVAAASTSSLSAVGSWAESAAATSFSPIAFAGASTTTMTADFGTTAAFLSGYRLRLSVTYEAAS